MPTITPAVARVIAWFLLVPNGPYINPPPRLRISPLPTARSRRLGAPSRLAALASRARLPLAADRSLEGYRQFAGKVANMRAMAFAAQPHVNILFPVPYAENEEHPLIITNQRIVQRHPAGVVELPTREVHFVGRK